jgi:hypothetical protein
MTLSKEFKISWIKRHGIKYCTITSSKRISISSEKTQMALNMAVKPITAERLGASLDFQNIDIS